LDAFNSVFRFTDFLVFEVDLDGNVIHLKSLAKPDPPKKNPAEENLAEEDVEGKSMQETVPESTVQENIQNAAENELSAKLEPEKSTGEEKSDEPWPESFDTKLSLYLSTESIAQLKEMYLQGPEPPRVSDSGWAGRVKTSSDDASGSTGVAQESDVDKEPQERGRGRGGKRGGRGGGRGGRRGQDREDHRKVLSEVGLPNPLAFVLLLFLNANKTPSPLNPRLPAQLSIN